MIWIVDDVETKPGMGQAFLEAYMAHYAPGAKARGLTLIHRMVEPAMWRDDAPNRVLLVWTAADAKGVWAAKVAARYDSDVLRWWREEAPALIMARRRSTMGAAELLEELSSV